MGCRAAVLQQIQQVQGRAGPFNRPKRVLVLGHRPASGWRPGSRSPSAPGPIPWRLVRAGSSDKGLGSAGWYNNIWFRQAAEQSRSHRRQPDRDAFSDTMRQQAIDVIRQQLGQVDLVVYSLASGVRVMPDGTQVRSVLKTTGQPLQGWGLDLEHDALVQQSLVPATPEEIRDTVTVMGARTGSAGCRHCSRRIAWPRRPDRCLLPYRPPSPPIPLSGRHHPGYAKEHLHATAETINLQLAGIGGHAWVSVCKALVTKASVFIPVLPSIWAC